MPKARRSLFYYVYDRVCNKLGVSLSNKLDKTYNKHYAGDVIFEIWDQTTAVVDGENSDGVEEIQFRVDDFMDDYTDDTEEW